MKKSEVQIGGVYVTARGNRRRVLSMEDDKVTFEVVLNPCGKGLAIGAVRTVSLSNFALNTKTKVTD